jgi:hypothetical protein
MLPRIQAEEAERHRRGADGQWRLRGRRCPPHGGQAGEGEAWRRGCPKVKANAAQLGAVGIGVRFVPPAAGGRQWLEQLGEAVLVLRTDDRGLDTGVANAKSKSQELGRTLDSTSGSATRLTKSLGDTGDAAGNAGAKTGEYSRQIAQLKAAVDPAWGALEKFKDQAALARDAMQQGAITGKQASISCAAARRLRAC